MSDPVQSLDPTVVTRPDLTKGAGTVRTCSAQFTFNIRTLADIANEFDVDKSNEKGVTLTRGCKHQARKDIADRLRGRKFLIDRAGRELPTAMGFFEDETLRVVGDFIPDSTNERFHMDPVGLEYEAIRFKLFLKAILQHARLLYTNEQDENLMVFQVDPDATAGEGFIQALFQAGGEDRNIYVSMTEVTNLRFS